MILTPEQQAEIAANKKRYDELKAAGQGNAPRALPAPTLRDSVPIEDTAIIDRETIPGGWYWTTRLARGERMLVVEDEPTVAHLIADVLGEEGFARSLTATDLEYLFSED